MRFSQIMKNMARPINSATNDYISRPNSNSISSALQHYIQSDHPKHGHKIHAHIHKIGYTPNTNISIKLLILYLRSASLQYARQVFDQMSQPTTSSYNSMIAGYFKHGKIEESMGLIRKFAMSDQEADGFTFSMMLKLSTRVKDMGKQVHCWIVRSCVDIDDVLSTALVDSYAKSGKLDYARRVFDNMFERNVMCSTAMISGYMNLGEMENAEGIFRRTIDKDVVVFNAMIEGYSRLKDTARRSVDVYIEMQRLGFCPTISTFVSMIGACSVLSEFEVGHQVQCQLMKLEFFTDVRCSSALVDMYSKCGRIEDARRIFDQMDNKNVFSWTSMIDGYGKNGNPNEALSLFDKMLKSKTVEPNNVTFLGALSACGHGGLVAEGWKIFKSMERDHMIKPRMEHYACMVDLLGRSGNLNEALDFIRGMPERPNSDVWAALLGASRLHDNAEMAGVAANEIFKLNSSERPGAYVALSNTLAATGKWDGVTGVRELMKERGVAKDSGCSWVGTESDLCRFHFGKNV
ncbi:Pentatricopeptide repeat-containing protein [Ranunculus cassubicifolius]